MSDYKVNKAACVGGGVIGSSWALLFAMKGVKTTLYDINDEQVEASKKNLIKNLDSLMELGAIDQKKYDETLANLSYTSDMKTAVADADFIQESGPERLEIKQSILANVEQYAGENVIYVTSTSGLLVTDIAAKAKNPKRCIGGHPYNPPHLIPLVEVALGDETAPQTVEAVKAFYERVGKEVVVLQKECPGFISNRLQMAIFREELDLVMRGVCTMEEAEKALVYGPGIRWGILGMGMILQLSAPAGFEASMNKLAPAANVYLADMARWTELPADQFPMVQKELDKMMENNPDYVGHDNESIAKFRDKCLVDILKLHKKF